MASTGADRLADSAAVSLARLIDWREVARHAAKSVSADADVVSCAGAEVQAADVLAAVNRGGKGMARPRDAFAQLVQETVESLRMTAEACGRKTSIPPRQQVFVVKALRDALQTFTAAVYAEVRSPTPDMHEPLLKYKASLDKIRATCTAASRRPSGSSGGGGLSSIHFTTITKFLVSATFRFLQFVVISHAVPYAVTAARTATTGSAHDVMHLQMQLSGLYHLYKSASWIFRPSWGAFGVRFVTLNTMMLGGKAFVPTAMADMARSLIMRASGSYAYFLGEAIAYAVVFSVTRTFRFCSKILLKNMLKAYFYMLSFGSIKDKIFFTTTLTAVTGHYTTEAVQTARDRRVLERLMAYDYKLQADVFARGLEGLPQGLWQRVASSLKARMMALKRARANLRLDRTVDIDRAVQDMEEDVFYNASNYPVRMKSSPSPSRRGSPRGSPRAVMNAFGGSRNSSRNSGGGANRSRSPRASTRSGRVF